MKKVDTIRMERSAPAPRVKRRHSAEFKARILTECAARGASVAGVALAHGVNANLVRKWIVTKRRALAPTMSATTLLPVRMATEEVTALTIPKRSGVARPGEAIEIELAGARIRVRADFDADVLSAVLRIVRDSLQR